MYTYLYDSRDG